MLFLYGEVLVLLLFSFGIGAAVAAFVVRALVKDAPAELTGRTGDGPVVAPVAESGGTP